MRKYQTVFFLLLILGIFAVIEGLFLKWISLDPQYSLYVYETIHLHHWILGIVLVIISIIGLLYERKRWRRKQLV